MKQPTLFLLAISLAGVAGARVPTIEDLLAIETVGGARISPDGKWVAFTRTVADMEADAYVTQIWLVDVAGKDRFQLTRGTKSSTNPKWSPDGKWIAFTSARSGDESQIHVIAAGGGEARALTESETSISDFEWSPNGRSIAYTATDPDSEPRKDRSKQFGDFQVVRGEYRHSHLWTVEVPETLKRPSSGRKRTSGQEFSVNDFSFSPDGARIAFSATINPDLVHRGTSDVYLLDLADDSVETLVARPGPDSDPHWSPDGSTVVFSTYGGTEKYYASNNELALVPVGGGEITPLTADFDEMPSFVAWNQDGIYFWAFQKTASHLFRVDPASRSLSRVSAPDGLMADSFSLAADGKKAAFVSQTKTSLREVEVATLEPFDSFVLTDETRQVEDLTLATREVISWKSKDGTTIEGILVKPADFVPGKTYPLLLVIHGGPTGIDRPSFRDNRYYPVDIWASRGALVLKVNYRGSAGYGESFRKLNMRNLGVGDAWDVLSGVDHLVEKGWVDPEKLGCMGWSQGGYISAFLTTSSNRFAAISVGAGISNWATYYYNTDITPFTINYLGDDPVDDPEIYRKTSPMSYIENATTPTLIQHGEFDRRVPIPNGFELRQGLEDRGVPVEMVVYKGFGHGIDKPRSQRAVMRHNLLWFNHHIFGDPPPSLSDLGEGGEDVR